MYLSLIDCMKIFWASNSTILCIHKAMQMEMRYIEEDEFLLHYPLYELPSLFIVCWFELLNKLNFVGMKMEVFCQNSLRSVSWNFKLLRMMQNLCFGIFGGTLVYSNNIFKRPNRTLSRRSFTVHNRPSFFNCLITLPMVDILKALFRLKILRSSRAVSE